MITEATTVPELASLLDRHALQIKHWFFSRGHWVACVEDSDGVRYTRTAIEPGAALNAAFVAALAEET